MNTSRVVTKTGLRRLVAAMVVMGVALPDAVCAQKKRNPASKMYVSDVGGEAVINTGEAVHDITRRSVYIAEGTVIETKAVGEAAPEDTFSTLVYSNGTGAYFGADTRVELRQFVQEPFTPNRSDVDVEPSISRTQAYVARGEVGLCNSRQVAGSAMTYRTPHGSVNIRGRRIVIETNNDVTRISMLEGDSTVRAGSMDLGGHTIQAGEQAVIRPGGIGQPNIIEIVRIPDNALPMLDEKVGRACQAKSAVYFDVRETSSTAPGAEGAAAEVLAEGAENAPGPAITAFDEVTAGPGAAAPTSEIIAVEVVPVNLPVEHTLSTSAIPVSGT